jgi:hypothetical protein
MTDDQKTTPPKTEPNAEDLERIIPDKHRRQTFLDLLAHLDSDTPAMLALKGHLVIEEKITSAIDKFVFHPEYLDDARLTFAQKLLFARALSLDEHTNSMWDLLARLNKLRNTLSHSLDGERRARAMNALKDAYVMECGGKLQDQDAADEAPVLGAVSLCLGFIDSFEKEVERFREHVDVLDTIVNQHRHPMR